MRDLWDDLPTVGRVALVVSLLGFVVRLTFESSTTSNGTIVECSYTDVGALALGATAIVTGLLTALKSQDAARRGLLVAVGVTAVLLGGLHVARGFGAFHDCDGGGNRSSDAVGFGPDDVLDRAEDQFGQPSTPPSAPSVPTPTGSWQTVIELGSTHRDEVLALDLPDGWRVTSDGSGTVTRQQLPDAQSSDGAIELAGHAKGVTPEERAELLAELEAEGWTRSTLGPWDVWTALDRGNHLVDRHRYTVVAEDLYVALSFSTDPEGADPTAEIAQIMATFSLG